MGRECGRLCLHLPAPRRGRACSAMEAAPLTGVLVTLNRLVHSGRIGPPDKGAIKDLALAGDARVTAAYLAFLQTGDDADLADSWTRILAASRLAASSTPTSSLPTAAPEESATHAEESLVALARETWLPFYRFVQEQTQAADSKAALARIERRARLEIGRLMFTSERLRLSSSDGGDVSGTEDGRTEKERQLDRDLAALSIQDLCVKYGGQGAYQRRSVRLCSRVHDSFAPRILILRRPSNEADGESTHRTPSSRGR